MYTSTVALACCTCHGRNVRRANYRHAVRGIDGQEVNFNGVTLPNISADITRVRRDLICNRE